MLFERHNLSGVLCVKGIKSASNAFIAEPCDVRKVGKNPLPSEKYINDAVVDLNVRRFCQELTHIIHCDSPRLTTQGLGEPTFNFSQDVKSFAFETVAQ
jgi:hypothetical protein